MDGQSPVAFLLHCFIDVDHSCSRINHAESTMMKISSPLIIIWKHLIFVSLTKTTILCYSSSIEITGASFPSHHASCLDPKLEVNRPFVLCVCMCLSIFVTLFVARP
jgi:hypothetical protein